MTNKIGVIGGGPTGLIFSLLNKDSNVTIFLLEARSIFARKNDKRALALSNSSRYILEKINVWDDLQKNIIPIKSIHTSQKGTFGRSKLNAEEFNLSALGYIVSYGELMSILEEKIAIQKNVEISYDTKVIKVLGEGINQEVVFNKNEKQASYRYNLLVLSDGGQSTIDGLKIKKTENFFQDSAIVSQVITDKPHKNIAFERFTTSGPIALLPSHNGTFSLVWTAKNDTIKALMELNEINFLQSLQEQFGERAGLFESCGERKTFPLSQTYITDIDNNNIVAISNAAQTMHPVGGQGLNTGLRDALTLASMIQGNDMEISTENLISNYLQSRKAETDGMLKITEGLATFFANDLILVNRFRGLALTILDCSPVLKQKFVKKMSYGKY